MDLKYIKGTFKQYIYKGDKGFTIGLFKIKDTNDEDMKSYQNRTITFSGTFFDLVENENYLFYGNSIVHPKYGFQYNVRIYELMKPDDQDGVVSFLSSKLFKGVGEKTAQMIVDVLKDQAIDLILNDYNCLLKVPKMTEVKAKGIYETLKYHEDSRKLMVDLCNKGFSSKEALDVYQFYKKKTFDIIDRDIYQLCDDIEDITFSKIDKLRHNFGIVDDDERRIKAAIINAIQSLCFANGDTYLYIDEIKKATFNLLKMEIEEDKLDYYIFLLNKEGKIVIDEQTDYYLKNYYNNERFIANMIGRLINIKPIKYPDLVKNITELETINQITYDEKQRLAIRKSMENNLLIITGGPGTGKTTIIKGVVMLYQKINNWNFDVLTQKLTLLAPTGRAAKRMSEATNLPAQTIHKFLGWDKETNLFELDENNKSNTKFVIIDEVSMVDNDLMAALLKALPVDVKILLVGDYNQLPSVSPGQVLKDLIDSKVVDTIELELLYRQKEDSYINKLAFDIKNNCLTTELLEKKADYQFIECSNDEIKEVIKKVAIQAKEKNYDFKEFQVLIPMYKGQNGINNINMILQEVFNPKDENKRELEYGEVIYRIGDKVLQLKNMPDNNVYNGDMGIICDIKNPKETASKRKEIWINFEGNIVKYTPTLFSTFMHGYAISVHKAQGSEFKIIAMPFTSAYHMMLYRKLIYTGVTRAKKSLILIGSSYYFRVGVNNDDEQMRKTKLKDLLIKNV